ncbi:uncharacterized protein BXZ73DRAFT_74671 [Epithele typhae]|uniref:uncharacterized protein n=1 Tax=Epithele typhae TaxID=378194 RepID=UPI0020082D08|nr:uncharacterized protein BXZ73DRAFT_74671 [Epithele typhae]KAH9942409.1 hypothetical protein BXZ73DRAFT_74671 [Epithele typhae]
MRPLILSGLALALLSAPAYAAPLAITTVISIPPFIPLYTVQLSLPDEIPNPPMPTDAPQNKAGANNLGHSLLGARNVGFRQADYGINPTAAFVALAPKVPQVKQAVPSPTSAAAATAIRSRRADTDVVYHEEHSSSQPYSDSPRYSGDRDYSAEKYYADNASYSGVEDYSKDASYSGEKYYSKDAPYTGDKYYSKDALYTGDKYYSKDAPYTGDKYYSKDAPYTSDTYYSEDASYSGIEDYSKAAPYSGVEYYSKDATYSGDKYYSDGVPYSGVEYYSKDAPYTGVEDYSEAVPYSDVAPYTGVAPYSREKYYSKDAPYSGVEYYSKNVPYTGDKYYSKEAPYTGDKYYSKEAPYTGDKYYSKEAPYTGDKYYSKEAPYTGDKYYSKEAPYTGAEYYSKNAPYTGVEGYSKDAPYTGDKYYSDGVPYTGDKYYSDGVPYSGEQSFSGDKYFSRPVEYTSNKSYSGDKYYVPEQRYSAGGQYSDDEMYSKTSASYQPESKFPSSYATSPGSSAPNGGHAASYVTETHQNQRRSSTPAVDPVAASDSTAKDASSGVGKTTTAVAAPFMLAGTGFKAAGASRYTLGYFTHDSLASAFNSDSSRSAVAPNFTSQQRTTKRTTGLVRRAPHSLELSTDAILPSRLPSDLDTSDPYALEEEARRRRVGLVNIDSNRPGIHPPAELDATDLPTDEAEQEAEDAELAGEYAEEGDTSGAEQKVDQAAAGASDVGADRLEGQGVGTVPQGDGQGRSAKGKGQLGGPQTEALRRPVQQAQGHIGQGHGGQHIPSANMQGPVRAFRQVHRRTM